MDIGSHCVVCGRLDFLPFDCRRCGQTLCGDHRVHECVEAPGGESIGKVSARAQSMAERTAHAKGSRIDQRVADQKTPTPAGKPADKTADQRTAGKPTGKPAGKQAGQRLGGAKTVKNDRAMAALDRLKQLVGARSKPDPRSAQGPSAECRRNAIGNAQLPLSERTYFQIERARHEYMDQLTQKTVTREAKSACMFFDKQMTAGQILDRAAKQLAVPKADLHDSADRSIDLGTPATSLPQHLIIVPK